MNNRLMFRQGDILIAQVNEKPKLGKKCKRERGQVVLAHGEVTGHMHAIDAVDALLQEIAGSEDRWLSVPSGAEVTHQEHDTINLPPGEYVVRRQREYTPERIIRVAD